MYTIKQCRKFARMSVKQTAKELGISVNRYKKIERYAIEMSIAEGCYFSDITGISINKIFFTKNI